MKSLCITIDFFPISGGARAIVSEIWRAFHKDYEVHFLTIPPSGYSGQYKIHRLQKTRRHYVPCNPALFPLNLLYMLWGTLSLLKLNKQYRFDAILAQDGVFTGFYSAIVGKLTNTKVVIMDYGATTNYLSDAYWNFQKAVENPAKRMLYSLHTSLLRRSASLAISITTKIADKFAVLGYELTEIYHKMKIHDSKIGIIQYSVDENFYAPLEEGKAARKQELGISQDSIVVNATCRLSQEKGIEYLMPALKQAVDKNGKIVCLIVGSGIMQNFASHFIRENNLEEKIRLMGEAAPRRVRDLLQISDIFIYAGVTGSNVSLAVLEAMATKCAVVASNSPKSHENLLADNRGIVVPVGDSSEIGKAVLLLASDAVLRKNMGEKSRKWVIENHSIESLKEKITALLGA
jgi:glycosyltransferase involved in cell wall biosynthesis